MRATNIQEWFIKVTATGALIGAATGEAEPATAFVIFGVLAPIVVLRARIAHWPTGRTLGLVCGLSTGLIAAFAELSDAWLLWVACVGQVAVMQALIVASDRRFARLQAFVVAHESELRGGAILEHRGMRIDMSTQFVSFEARFGCLLIAPCVGTPLVERGNSGARGWRALSIAATLVFGFLTHPVYWFFSARSLIRNLGRGEVWSMEAVLPQHDEPGDLIREANRKAAEALEALRSA